MRGAVLGLALAAPAGCVTMQGPCRIEGDAGARTLACEQGGFMAILAPSRVIEAIGAAASAASSRGDHAN
jgi:hypothetical protein